MRIGLRQILFSRPHIVAANNISLDGTPTSAAWSSGLTFAGSLTTALGGDKVFCAVTSNIVSPTGVGGSTLGAFTKVGDSSGVGTSVQLWAVTGGGSPLSSEAITITYGSTPSFAEAIFFAFHGVNTATNGGFDGSPFQATSGNISFTTSNPVDALLAVFRDGGNGSTTAGWASLGLGGSASFTTVQYKLVTAIQSALSIADPNGTNSGVLGHALVSL
jgi:hypothetical protein